MTEMFLIVIVFKFRKKDVDHDIFLSSHRSKMAASSYHEAVFAIAFAEITFCN